mgnify:CR=1 FL=1
MDSAKKPKPNWSRRINAATACIWVLAAILQGLAGNMAFCCINVALACLYAAIARYAVTEA